MNHYFTNDENLKSELRSISMNYCNTSFVFITDNGVFSKNNIDFGSRLLVDEYLKVNNSKKEILDLGCGYGVIGVTISKLTGSHVLMADVNKRSVHLTNINIKKNEVNAEAIVSDIYSNINDKFDVIITNPPIRAGKKVYITMLTDAKKYLNQNGELWFVIRKEQGAKSTYELMKKIYDVEIVKKYKGYCIFKAVVR